MNKTNVFRSSNFYMDDGDILHMLVKEDTGDRGQIGLYNTTDTIAEGIVTSRLDLYTDVRDGNVYTEVMMGEQIWMAENFRYNFAGSQQYDVAYGRLYTPAMMVNPAFIPAGWHVPTTAEWQTLIDFCGGIVKADNMKSIGTTYWSVGGTNFGEMDIRGGGYYKSGVFDFQRRQAYFFCNTGAGQYVMFSGPPVIIGFADAAVYISVRLIKD